MIKNIKNIVPCTHELYAGFKFDDNIKTIFERVILWGLVELEEYGSLYSCIYGVTVHSDSKQIEDFAEETPDFKGYFTKEEMEEQKESEK